MKARLRDGAKLIVVDPRRIDLVRSPHVEADYHLPLKPGTNVAVVTAMAHVIVTEGLVNEKFVRERCDWDEFQDWAAFVAEERNSPEQSEKFTGVPAADVRAAARHGARVTGAKIVYCYTPARWLYDQRGRYLAGSSGRRRPPSPPWPRHCDAGTAGPPPRPTATW